MTMHKENFNEFLGRVVSNPLDGISPDTKINIVQSVFVPNDPPGVYAIHNLAHYRGILLSVHFVTDTWSIILGSAVMVAPGIAITAAHVVKDHLDPIMRSELDIACTGITPSGLQHWRVRQVVNVKGTDLMILSLEYGSPLPPDNCFMQATMTTRLPQIGETVMIAGFRASDEHVPALELPDEKIPHFPVCDGFLKYGVRLQIGVGEVTQYHLHGRGTMVPGPAIEVACSTPGGLSGGPAFDRNGRLVGVLSSSLNDPDGRGPSQISLLAPALTHTIMPSFLPHIYRRPITLLGLPPNLCGIEGRDAICSTTDPETGIICVEMRDWPS